MTAALRRLLAFLVLGALLPFAACGRSNDDASDDSPTPALSQAGSRWQVSRGDRTVLTVINAPGTLRWSSGPVEHPFLSGESKGKAEEAKLKRIARESRHFRDFIHRLERAGYGVAAADTPEKGP